MSKKLNSARGFVADCGNFKEFSLFKDKIGKELCNFCSANFPFVQPCLLHRMICLDSCLNTDWVQHFQVSTSERLGEDR